MRRKRRRRRGKAKKTCVCVCVCVSEREREEEDREKKTEREREREKESRRKRERRRKEKIEVESTMVPHQVLRACEDLLELAERKKDSFSKAGDRRRAMAICCHTLNEGFCKVPAFVDAEALAASIHARFGSQLVNAVVDFFCEAEEFAFVPVDLLVNLAIERDAALLMVADDGALDTVCPCMRVAGKELAQKIIDLVATVTTHLDENQQMELMERHAECVRTGQEFKEEKL